MEEATARGGGAAMDADRRARPQPKDAETARGDGSAAIATDGGAQTQPEASAARCMDQPSGALLAGIDEAPAARLRQAALAHAGNALNTIVQIMNNDKASTGDRLRAAITVIERAYGKQDGAGSEGSKADMLEDIREELARMRGQGTRSAGPEAREGEDSSRSVKEG